MEKSASSLLCLVRNGFVSASLLATAQGALAGEYASFQKAANVVTGTFKLSPDMKMRGFKQYAADRFKGQWFVCAMPDADGTLRPIDKAEGQPGVALLRDGLAMAKDLPNFSMLPGQEMESFCVTTSPVKKRNAALGTATADYMPIQNVTVIYSDPATASVEGAAINMLHEHTHAGYAQQPEGRWKDILRTGGDVIFDRMVNEGHAYARQAEAAYIVFVLQQNPAFINASTTYAGTMMNSVAGLYTNEALTNYIAEHGELPGLMVRSAFTYAMLTLQDNIYLKDFQRISGHPELAAMTLSPGEGDRYLHDHTQYVRGNIGDMPGITKYLRDHSVLGSESRHRDMKLDAHARGNFVPAYLQFMQDMSGLQYMPENESTIERYREILKPLNASGDLQYPFIVNDLRDTMDVLQQSLQHAPLSASVKAERVELVKTVRGQLDDLAGRFCKPSSVSGAVAKQARHCIPT